MKAERKIYLFLLPVHSNFKSCFYQAVLKVKKKKKRKKKKTRINQSHTFQKLSETKLLVTVN